MPYSFVSGDVAAEEARRDGIGSVEWRLGEVAAVDEHEVDRFDMVYARFLLTHLADPGNALDAMLRRVRPSGVVAVEDIDVDAHFCWPPSPAFDQYVQWYTAAHRAKGGDPLIGRRLPLMLHERGVVDIDVGVVQPVTFDGDVAAIAEATLDAVGPAIEACGAATTDDIRDLARRLSADLAEPGRIVSMPRVVQTFGRRPDGARHG